MDNNASLVSARGRIEFLDELRGLCILCMVFFHLFFDLAFIFDLKAGRALYSFFEPAQPFFAALFIIICGICCRLSRSNIRRAFLIAAAAAAVSVVTYGLSRLNIVDPIYFGILHLLAVSVLLFAAARPLLDKIPPIIGIILSVISAVATRDIAYGTIGFPGFKFHITLPAYFAVPLGIDSTRQAFSDYFPLFPWIFIFLSGTFIGRYFTSGRVHDFFYKKHIPPLGFVGRHSLIIYVLHQPVIYGLLMAIEAMIRFFAA